MPPVSDWFSICHRIWSEQWNITIYWLGDFWPKKKIFFYSSKRQEIMFSFLFYDNAMRAYDPWHLYNQPVGKTSTRKIAEEGTGIVWAFWLFHLAADHIIPRVFLLISIYEMWNFVTVKATWVWVFYYLLMQSKMAKCLFSKCMCICA